MKQMINWLRQHWIDLTNSLSARENTNNLLENQSDTSFKESLERPVNKVYYSIPGRGTFWAYIDKGRIIKPKTIFIKVKMKRPQ